MVRRCERGTRNMAGHGRAVPTGTRRAAGARDLSTLTGALGETLTTQFLKLKRDESLAYQRHVSDWELQRYAAAF